jgi:hypothetical protein
MHLTCVEAGKDQSSSTEPRWPGEPFGSAGPEQSVEQAAPNGVLANASMINDQTVSQVNADLAELLDAFDGAIKNEGPDCLGDHFRTRYRAGNPQVELDRQSSILIDSALEAHDVVERLANEIRDDFTCVLVNCRERLKTDRNDIVARARLGLTLLLLFQDDEAYRELQQVFLRSPASRPHLRILVNEARQQRASLAAQMMIVAYLREMAQSLSEP